ncbi:MAG: MBL fold metallo-hydrolase [Clostridia bacterium]|nr:MBL fold metallo-hydrolase [Clostridia bacterium]
MAQKKSQNNRRTPSPQKKAASTAKRYVKRQVRKTARRHPILVLSIVLIAIVLLVGGFFLAQRFGLLDAFLGGESATTEQATRAPVRPVDGTAEIHMIDMGQGDSILLSTAEGYMLIDAGDNNNASRQAIVDYLNGKGVAELEWLVLTHPDADHIGGAKKVIETYHVKRVLLSDRTNSTATYNNMIQAILDSEGTEVYIIETDDTLSTDPTVTATIWHAGQTFSLGDVDFKVLGPISTPSSNNNASVVLQMQFGATSALLTGDMEEAEIADVMATYAAYIPCDLLKVGHHGSRNANTQALIEAAHPTYAIISCGEGNDYGHPHAETIERLTAVGAVILRTDLRGDIVFVTDGTSWSYTTEK